MEEVVDILYTKSVSGVVKNVKLTRENPSKLGVRWDVDIDAILILDGSCVANETMHIGACDVVGLLVMNQPAFFDIMNNRHTGKADIIAKIGSIVYPRRYSMCEAELFNMAGVKPQEFACISPICLIQYLIGAGWYMALVENVAEYRHLLVEGSTQDVDLFNQPTYGGTFFTETNSMTVNEQLDKDAAESVDVHVSATSWGDTDGGKAPCKDKELIIGVATNVVTLPETVAYVHGIDGNAFMCRMNNTRGVGGKPMEKYFLEEGHALMEELNVKNIVLHAPSSINLASSNEKVIGLGFDMLYSEIERGGVLGAKNLVMHAGINSTVSMEESIKKIIESLTDHKITYNLERFKMKILFETMFGRKGEVGNHITELVELLNKIPTEFQSMFGVCLDTSHMWAMGYQLPDPDALLAYICSMMDINRIGVVHIQGSAQPKGSCKDSHTNIGATDQYPTGADQIGAENIYRLVHNPLIKNSIFILETPTIDNWDVHKAEIEYLRLLYT